jgi:hypothetical protein
MICSLIPVAPTLVDSYVSSTPHVAERDAAALWDQSLRTQLEWMCSLTKVLRDIHTAFAATVGDPDDNAELGAIRLIHHALSRNLEADPVVRSAARSI